MTPSPFTFSRCWLYAASLLGLAVALTSEAVEASCGDWLKSHATHSVRHEGAETGANGTVHGTADGAADGTRSVPATLPACRSGELPPRTPPEGLASISAQDQGVLGDPVDGIVTHRISLIAFNDAARASRGFPLKIVYPP